MANLATKTGRPEYKQQFIQGDEEGKLPKELTMKRPMHAMESYRGNCNPGRKPCPKVTFLGRKRREKAASLVAVLQGTMSAEAPSYQEMPRRINFGEAHHQDPIRISRQFQRFTI